MSLPQGVRGILLDIEGTTTPVSFVYDVLFPFARERLDDACSRAQHDERIRHAVDLLREEHGREAEAPRNFGNGGPFARWLMERDRKSTGLKTLQGIIWEEGYRSGELRASLFPDVADALRAWREAGLEMRIFSSGSVLAQKLLFSHTEQGDLTSFFDGYHDTTTGPKREARSYEAIAGAFSVPPAEILFLSDVVAELDAAKTAGMATGLLVRPGNQPTEPGGHPRYRDFRPLLA